MFIGGIKMDFGKALEEMKDYKKARLPFWNRNTHVCIEQSHDYSHPYLVVESDKGAVPWIPTYPEIFSEDWEIVKIKETL